MIFGIHSHPGKDATKGASGANVSINGKSDMLKMKKMVNQFIDKKIYTDKNFPKKIGRASCRERVSSPV